MWTVPAVTVAVAAPAYATSHGLAVTDLQAAYVPDQPEKLSVTATVTGFTGGYSMALTLPDGVFDTVNGSATSTAVVQGTGGSFQTTLDLGSTAASPWRGYRGPALTSLTAVATDAGGASHPATTSVTAVPVSRLAPATAAVTGDPATSLAVSMEDVGLLSDNTSAIGRLRIAVVLPASASGQAPTVASVSPGWKVDPLLSPNPTFQDGGWVARFVTTQEAHTARTGNTLDRGPAGFHFDAQLVTAGASITSGAAAAFYLTSDETAFGWPEDTWKVNRVERFPTIP